VFAEWAIDGGLDGNTRRQKGVGTSRRQVPDRQAALETAPDGLPHEPNHPTGYSMNNIRRQVVIAAALLAAAQMSGSALAQAYPSKPITIVVAYPAGGDTDAMARLYAEKLGQRLGQPVVVDNRPVPAAPSAPCMWPRPRRRLHLLLAPNTFAIAQFVLKTRGFELRRARRLHAHRADQRAAHVRGRQPGSGIKDIKTLASQGKRDGLTYASPGSGSPMHILGEMFNKAAGTKLSHIPYKGVAPAVNDLIGGHVPTTFMTWGPIAPYAGGKVNVLAVADASAARWHRMCPRWPSRASRTWKCRPGKACSAPRA
jgi:tripartite-type tricarboxylate transporter receptor subunit TctC